MLIENELHLSRKFFLLMIVLFAYISESTDNSVILGSHSKSGKEKVWRYFICKVVLRIYLRVDSLQ